MHAQQQCTAALHGPAVGVAQDRGLDTMALADMLAANRCHLEHQVVGVCHQHCGLCCRTGASYSMADLECVAAGQARNIILLDAGEEVGLHNCCASFLRSLHLKVQQGRAARANMPRCFYAAVSGTDCMHAFV